MNARAVLLTWNPGPDDDRRFTPREWFDALVAPLSRGQVVATTWGVGRHVNYFTPGEPAFLYRQGGRGRGLVARGVLASGPRPDPERARNIVDVDWLDSVPVDHPMPVDDLEAAAPSFGWRQVWGSGRHLPADVTTAVLAAWAEHVADVARSQPGPAGASGTADPPGR